MAVILPTLFFQILPPWYRNRNCLCYIIWFYFFWLYGMFIAGMIHVKRKKEQVVFEKDKEIHHLEKEYEREGYKERQIMELEKKSWNTICK